MIFISQSTTPTVMPKVILLLWVIHLSFTYIVDSNNVHYITPSPTTQCPGESCLTLSTLAVNSSKYFDPNTTMVFLKGSHTLDSELILSNINGSLMLSTNGSDTAAIVCSGTNASLKFFHITQLQISGLEFIRCSSMVELVDQFTLENSSFCGGNNDTALYLNHTNTKITGSSFVSNTAGTYQSDVLGLALLQYSVVNVSESWLRSKIQSTSTRVGGALVVTSSNVTISSSHFDSNTAKVGGAIFLQLESSINVSDCTFINNSVTGCSDDGCLGGVLFIDSGCTVTAHNCIFMNNTAEYGGGAIALFQGTFSDSGYNAFNINGGCIFGGAIFAYGPSTITMDNSRYCNNTGRYGGAIYALSFSNITVDKNVFNNNEAGEQGGVVFIWHSSSITVTNSSFNNNEASEQGGVVFIWRSSNITVTNSSFDKNKAVNHGGVILAYFNSSITVSYSSFNNSVAGGNGGVMYANDSSSITVDSSSFDNNTAGNVGGVVGAWNMSSISVGDSFFESNKAYRGGVLFGEEDSSITVSNCSFGNNKAERHGGVMSVYSNSIIVVRISYFDDNTASNNGGVIYAKGNNNITVNSSSFDNNTAGNFGAVANVWKKSSISVGDSLFVNNEAGSGGVLYGKKSSSITVSNSSFITNKADDGGVMYAYFSSSISVSDSYFENNKADDSGGVLFGKKNSSISVSNSFFCNNKAERHGGVMNVYSNSIIVRISFFDNNSAGHDGGVMAAFINSNITVCNSSFINSATGDDGGIMFAKDSSNITVDSSSFANNIAGNVGGVAVALSTSSISVGDSFFENNVAGRGGVLFGEKISSITVSNSSFINNKADNGGVMVAHTYSNITVRNSSFDKNVASRSVGGVMSAYSRSSISVSDSLFENNEADGSGGVLFGEYNSSITVSNSTFINNKADDGGVMVAHTYSNIAVGNSSFYENVAGRYDGGVMSTHSSSSISVSDSLFENNEADGSGGVLFGENNSSITISNSSFGNNKAARHGGVMNVYSNSIIVICFSFFDDNTAGNDGGVIYASSSSNVAVGNSSFYNNKADENGGVVCFLLNSQLNTMGDNNFIGNQAFSGGVAYVKESNINIHSQALLMANNTANSGGVMHVSGSRVDIYNGSLLMANNTAKDTGGAVYSSQSNLSFVSGNNTFERNKAKIGGAIYLDDGQLLFVNGKSILIRNIAAYNGGGLYLTTSKLKIRGEHSYFTRNRANGNGGGIYASNSSIIIEGAVDFVSNEAKDGGGISLETNARLCKTSAGVGLINFVANNASRYGGAIFVDDKTNPYMCAAVNMLNTTPSIACFSKSVLIDVSNNSAGESGSMLFGGLLDRCTVDSRHFMRNETYELGIVNFLNSININRTRLDSISSHPVRLCFCRDGEPDCKYQPEPIQVNRGKSISIELIAYDQVHQAVSANIHCRHNLSAGGLGDGQQIQLISKECTELKYKVFTTNEYATLTFSAEKDPCENISKRSIMISITCFCTIGFQVMTNNDKASCDCVCHPIILKLSKIIECSQTTESIMRRENCWISYVNHTWSNSSGYIIYPHCPFDYCYSPDKQVSINLNLPNGSDAQCDSNRTGTLCGTCKSGLSVSLGSSKCMLCPTYWPVLLVTVTIIFILSGIGLVAFLLALNLTVAVGTLNAIIFYANIVVANKSAFFPSGVSPASVFISWLNFDLGFDTCFFNGMDTYVKTWLQLAFPIYIIILVVVIIQLSYYFNSFGRLLGKKDPVATLATLILLSYTKLLQIIIIAFSSATLVYPDGSKKSLWLPDATVEYFTSKHIVLFFVAILIFLAGLIYTLLLFLWQWLLHSPRKQVKWIRNPKLSSFMGIYLVPYTPKHRYWTGLLLLVRISVYLVSAFNPTGDPKVTLSATNFITSSLVIYIATFGVKMYNNRFINAIETLTYFNIITLSIFTWYTLDADTNQMAIINISVGIVFIQLIVVIVYHLYKHMNQKLFATIKRSVVCMKIKTLISQEQRTRNYDDTNVLLDFVDHPLNTNNYYNFSQIQPRSPNPLQSVVELPNSKLTLAIPPSLEAKVEESKLESAVHVQQVNEQDDISVIPEKESLSVEVCENIDDYSGIERVECNENQKVEIEHSASVKENLIPKPNFNVQINYCPKTESDAFKEANNEAVEILQSDNKDQGKQEVLLFPANSDQQVHGSWFSVHHH